MEYYFLPEGIVNDARFIEYVKKVFPNGEEDYSIYLKGKYIGELQGKIEKLSRIEVSYFRKSAFFEQRLEYFDTQMEEIIEELFSYNGGFQSILKQLEDKNLCNTTNPIFYRVKLRELIQFMAESFVGYPVGFVLLREKREIKILDFADWIEQIVFHGSINKDRIYF